MKKAVVWGLGVVVGLPVALAGTAAVLVNTIDQQALLNNVSEVVKTDYNRTLAFNGPVKLKWFPSIGADLSGISLTEFASDKQFLSADKVSVSIAFMPLLSSQVVVDSVVAEGVSLNVVKNKEGKFNFDDLAGAGGDAPAEKPAEPTEGGQAVNFSVADISLSKLNLSYIDQAEGLQASLSDFSVTTGRIEPGVPTNVSIEGAVSANKPKVAINIKADTGLEFGLGEAMYAKLNGLSASVDGSVDGQAANVSVKADQLDLDPNKLTIDAKALVAEIAGALPDVGKVQASLNAPAIQLSDTKATGQSIKLKANLDQGERKVNADLDISNLSGNLKESVKADIALKAALDEGSRKVNVNLATPLQAHVENQTASLAALKGNVDITDPAVPKGKANLPIDAVIQLNNKAQTVSAKLKSEFEQTPINLEANVNNFANPFIKANLAAGKIDLDAIFPPSEKAESSKPAEGEANIDDIPVDLSPLKAINMDVVAKVQALKVSGVTVSDINVRALSQNGKLTVSPMTSKLYEGSSTGTVVADANTNAMVIKQTLSNIQIEPFLKEVLNRDLAQGKGDVKIDLTAKGKTVGEIKRNLNGQLAVSLADGAVKGINLGERLQSLGNLLSGGLSNQTAQAEPDKSTQFSSLGVSFDIKNGVATSNDLKIMAPLFRIGGQGVINLVENSLDYQADASIVATSTGQGGKTLDAGLVGLTVPVKLYGGFSAIQWKLLLEDLAKAALKKKANIDTDALKAQADAKKEALKKEAEAKQEELKSKAEDKLKDAFKGFLSR